MVSVTDSRTSSSIRKRKREVRERIIIETPRLRLIPCELRHFEAILTDQRQLEQMLGVIVFDDGFDFPGVADIEAMRFLYEYLKANPDALGWWTYLFVHAEDKVLIGPGGYKGKANEAGTVEIGYAIVPAYRRRGLATEAAQGLIDHAFAHARVKRVDAHTLAERNASVRVLEKVGMKFMGAVDDPDVGEVWHWSLHRADYQRR
ncbi:MAG: GNAT family N-acetyltransferase [Actinobacteria bacterium]|nr:GNAT family N-acetyltransferase [Actinomycetota bacterium]